MKELIEMLDAQIAKVEAELRKLLRARAALLSEEKPSVASHRRLGRPAGGSVTEARRDMMADHLRIHGSARMADLQRLMGNLSSSSFYKVVRDCPRFAQDERGLWILAETEQLPPIGTDT